MASKKAISDLEYISLLCWPGREVERYRGWIIQWNDGITWRANSVYPLEPVNDEALEEAIEYVISFYEQRDTVPAFKITEASEPEGLDETLIDMGFEKRMKTFVQTLPVNQLSCLDPEFPVDLLKVSDKSINALFQSAGFDETVQQARRSIIKRIEGEKIIARVMIDGKIAGIGLGVVKEDWLALFSIRTLEEYRHRGVARSINCALGIWGEENNATRIFLQVESKNFPALELYGSLGFETMYTYWYRILEMK